MRAARARGLFLALSLAAAGSITVATLATLAHAQEALRRTVVLRMTGPPAEAQRLEDTIRELLARTQVTLVASPQGAADDASVLALADVDIGRDGTVNAAVRDHRGHAVLDRVFPPDASAAIAREAVAEEVRIAVEAVLLAEEDRATAASASATPPTSAPLPSASASAQSPAPTPTPTPAPAPTPPPPPPPAPPAGPPHDVASATPHTPASWGLDLATLFSAGPVTNSGVVMRVGGAVTLASRRGLRPAITLSGAYAVPFDLNGQLVTAQANLVSARALPSLEVFHGRWLALEALAGGGVDVVEVEPRSALLPASTLGPSTTRVDPVFTAAVNARFAFASSVVFDVAIVADVDPTTRRYVLDQGGEQAELFALWKVRPGVVVGFAFTALGDAPFALAEGPR